jgi:heterodisulfide reductase subunit D
MEVKNLELEKYKEHVFRCYKCAYCVDTVSNYSLGGPIPPRGVDGVCMIYELKRFDHYTSRGRLAIARALLQNEIQYSPSLVELTYMCLTCGNCTKQCMGNPEIPGAGIDTPAIVEAMRADIVDAGMAPKAAQVFASRIEADHNPFRKSKEKRMEWSKDLDIPDKVEAETLLFAGCTPSYLTNEIKDTVRILKSANIDFTLLKDEWCCGSPLLSLGYRKLANEMALHNKEIIEKTKCKQVVCACPTCYKVFKTDYPKMVGNLPFEVKHITELIDELIKGENLKLTKSIEKKVTYHDPCHLGRHSGLYEQPRDILKAIPGLEFIDMYPNRDNAWCCGIGSIVNFLYGDISQNIAAKKINRINEMGVQSLVSACPSCKLNLTDAINRTKAPLEFYDLVELVAKSI